MHHPGNQLPRYRLTKGLDLWNLVFNGVPTVLKHEQGISYVSYLLANPPVEPIHALELIARAPGPAPHHSRRLEGADSRTRTAGQPDRGARIQERALGVDEAEALRALRRKEQELEAILDDADEFEPVKAEALRELEQIATHQRRHARRSEDNAQRAVRAVRRAIVRFHARLLEAGDADGRPHPVLRPFAEHLDRHLLIPSARYSGLRNAFARRGRIGCFTYEPPRGVVWEK